MWFWPSVPYKKCCCGGLFLLGCRTLLVSNVNELTHVAFRDEAHQYVLQEDEVVNLNLCSGGNGVGSGFGSSNNNGTRPKTR